MTVIGNLRDFGQDYSITISGGRFPPCKKNNASKLCKGLSFDLSCFLKKIFWKRQSQIAKKHCSIVGNVFAFLTLEEFGVLLSNIEFEL